MNPVHENDGLQSDQPIRRKAIKRPYVPSDKKLRSASENGEEAAMSSPSNPPVPEKVQEKFWTYESDKVTIDDGKLYKYLNKKGYRYYLDLNSGIKFIAIVVNDSFDVLLGNKLWRLCCCLVDKDFSTVPEEERIKVQAGLKVDKETIKKRRLVQVPPEDFERFGSESKKYLQSFSKKSETGKGNENENQ